MDSDVTQTSANVLTSTVGSVISSAAEGNESAPTVDSVPSSSSDANSVDVSARKKSSDDPISSTSDVTDKLYSKIAMGDSKRVTGKSELDNEVDLFANDCNLSHPPSEKITENVEDIVSDLENLLGNPTDHFTVSVSAKKSNVASELDIFFDVDKIDEKKTDRDVSISNITSNLEDKSVPCVSNVSVEDVKSESQNICKDVDASPDTNKQDSDENSEEYNNQEQSDATSKKTSLQQPDVTSLPPLSKPEAIDIRDECVEQKHQEGLNINLPLEPIANSSEESCSTNSNQTSEESTDTIKISSGTTRNSANTEQSTNTEVSDTPLQTAISVEDGTVVLQSDSIPVEKIEESNAFIKETSVQKVLEEELEISQSDKVLHCISETNKPTDEAAEVAKSEVTTIENSIETTTNEVPSTTTKAVSEITIEKCAIAPERTTEKAEDSLDVAPENSAETQIEVSADGEIEATEDLAVIRGTPKTVKNKENVTEPTSNAATGDTSEEVMTGDTSKTPKEENSQAVPENDPKTVKSISHIVTEDISKVALEDTSGTIDEDAIIVTTGEQLVFQDTPKSVTETSSQAETGNIEAVVEETPMDVDEALQCTFEKDSETTDVLKETDEISETAGVEATTDHHPDTTPDMATEETLKVEEEPECTRESEAVTEIHSKNITETECITSILKNSDRIQQDEELVLEEETKISKETTENEEITPVLNIVEVLPESDFPEESMAISKQPEIESDEDSSSDKPESTHGETLDEVKECIMNKCTTAVCTKDKEIEATELDDDSKPSEDIGVLPASDAPKESMEISKQLQIEANEDSSSDKPETTYDATSDEENECISNKSEIEGTELDDASKSSEDVQVLPASDILKESMETSKQPEIKSNEDSSGDKPETTNDGSSDEEKECTTDKSTTAVSTIDKEIEGTELDDASNPSEDVHVLPASDVPEESMEISKQAQIESDEDSSSDKPESANGKTSDEVKECVTNKSTTAVCTKDKEIEEDTKCLTDSKNDAANKEELVNTTVTDIGTKDEEMEEDKEFSSETENISSTADIPDFIKVKGSIKASGYSEGSISMPAKVGEAKVYPLKGEENIKSTTVAAFQEIEETSDTQKDSCEESSESEVLPNILKPDEVESLECLETPSMDKGGDADSTELTLEGDEATDEPIPEESDLPKSMLPSISIEDEKNIEGPNETEAQNATMEVDSEDSKSSEKEELEACHESETKMEDEEEASITLAKCDDSKSEETFIEEVEKSTETSIEEIPLTDLENKVKDGIKNAVIDTEGKKSDATAELHQPVVQQIVTESTTTKTQESKETKNIQETQPASIEEGTDKSISKQPEKIEECIESEDRTTVEESSPVEEVTESDSETEDPPEKMSTAPETNSSEDVETELEEIQDKPLEKQTTDEDIEESKMETTNASIEEQDKIQIGTPLETSPENTISSSDNERRLKFEESNEIQEIIEPEEERSDEQIMDTEAEMSKSELPDVEESKTEGEEVNSIILKNQEVEEPVKEEDAKETTIKSPESVEDTSNEEPCNAEDSLELEEVAEDSEKGEDMDKEEGSKVDSPELQHATNEDTKHLSKSEELTTMTQEAVEDSAKDEDMERVEEIKEDSPELENEHGDATTKNLSVFEEKAAEDSANDENIQEGNESEVSSPELENEQQEVAEDSVKNEGIEEAGTTKLDSPKLDEEATPELKNEHIKDTTKEDAKEPYKTEESSTLQQEFAEDSVMEEDNAETEETKVDLPKFDKEVVEVEEEEDANVPSESEEVAEDSVEDEDMGEAEETEVDSSKLEKEIIEDATKVEAKDPCKVDESPTLEQATAEDSENDEDMKEAEEAKMVSSELDKEVIDTETKEASKSEESPMLEQEVVDTEAKENENKPSESEESPILEQESVDVEAKEDENKPDKTEESSTLEQELHEDSKEDEDIVETKLEKEIVVAATKIDANEPCKTEEFPISEQTVVEDSTKKVDSPTLEEVDDEIEQSKAEESPMSDDEGSTNSEDFPEVKETNLELPELEKEVVGDVGKPFKPEQKVVESVNEVEVTKADSPDLEKNVVEDTMDSEEVETPDDKELLQEISPCVQKNDDDGQEETTTKMKDTDVKSLQETLSISIKDEIADVQTSADSSEDIKKEANIEHFVPTESTSTGDVSTEKREDGKSTKTLEDEEAAQENDLESSKILEEPITEKSAIEMEEESGPEEEIAAESGPEEENAAESSPEKSTIKTEEAESTKLVTEDENTSDTETCIEESAMETESSKFDEDTKLVSQTDAEDSVNKMIKVDEGKAESKEQKLKEDNKIQLESAEKSINSENIESEVILDQIENPESGIDQIESDTEDINSKSENIEKSPQVLEIDQEEEKELGTEKIGSEDEQPTEEMESESDERKNDEAKSPIEVAPIKDREESIPETSELKKKVETVVKIETIEKDTKTEPTELKQSNTKEEIVESIEDKEAESETVEADATEEVLEGDEDKTMEIKTEKIEELSVKPSGEETTKKAEAINSSESKKEPDTADALQSYVSDSKEDKDMTGMSSSAKIELLIPAEPDVSTSKELEKPSLKSSIEENIKETVIAVGTESLKSNDDEAEPKGISEALNPGKTEISRPVESDEAPSKELEVPVPNKLPISKESDLSTSKESEVSISKETEVSTSENPDVFTVKETEASPSEEPVESDVSMPAESEVSKVKNHEAIVQKSKTSSKDTAVDDMPEIKINSSKNAEDITMEVESSKEETVVTPDLIKCDISVFESAIVVEKQSVGKETEKVLTIEETAEESSEEAENKSAIDSLTVEAVSKKTNETPNISSAVETVQKVEESPMESKQDDEKIDHKKEITEEVVENILESRLDSEDHLESKKETEDKNEMEITEKISVPETKDKEESEEVILAVDTKIDDDTAMASKITITEEAKDDVSTETSDDVNTKDQNVAEVKEEHISQAIKEKQSSVSIDDVPQDTKSVLLENIAPEKDETSENKEQTVAKDVETKSTVEEANVTTSTVEIAKIESKSTRDKISHKTNTTENSEVHTKSTAEINPIREETEEAKPVAKKPKLQTKSSTENPKTEIKPIIKETKDVKPTAEPPEVQTKSLTEKTEVEIKPKTVPKVKTKLTKEKPVLQAKSSTGRTEVKSILITEESVAETKPTSKSIVEVKKLELQTKSLTEKTEVESNPATEESGEKIKSVVDQSVVDLEAPTKEPSKYSTEKPEPKSILTTKERKPTVEKLVVNKKSTAEKTKRKYATRKSEVETEESVVDTKSTTINKTVEPESTITEDTVENVETNEENENEAELQSKSKEKNLTETNLKEDFPDETGETVLKDFKEGTEKSKLKNSNEHKVSKKVMPVKRKRGKRIFKGLVVKKKLDIKKHPDSKGQEEKLDNTDHKEKPEVETVVVIEDHKEKPEVETVVVIEDHNEEVKAKRGRPVKKVALKTPPKKKRFLKQQLNKLDEIIELEKVKELAVEKDVALAVIATENVKVIVAGTKRKRNLRNQRKKVSVSPAAETEVVVETPVKEATMPEKPIEAGVGPKRRRNLRNQVDANAESPAEVKDSPTEPATKSIKDSVLPAAEIEAVVETPIKEPAIPEKPVETATGPKRRRNLRNQIETSSESPAKEADEGKDSPTEPAPKRRRVLRNQATEADTSASLETECEVIVEQIEKSVEPVKRRRRNQPEASNEAESVEVEIVDETEKVAVETSPVAKRRRHWRSQPEKPVLDTTMETEVTKPEVEGEQIEKPVESTTGVKRRRQGRSFPDKTVETVTNEAEAAVKPEESLGVVQKTIDKPVEPVALKKRRGWKKELEVSNEAESAPKVDQDILVNQTVQETTDKPVESPIGKKRRGWKKELEVTNDAESSPKAEKDAQKTGLVNQGVQETTDKPVESPIGKKRRGWRKEVEVNNEAESLPKTETEARKSTPVKAEQTDELVQEATEKPVEPIVVKKRRGWKKELVVSNEAESVPKSETDIQKSTPVKVEQTNQAFQESTDKPKKRRGWRKELEVSNEAESVLHEETEIEKAEESDKPAESVSGTKRKRNVKNQHDEALVQTTETETVADQSDTSNIKRKRLGRTQLEKPIESTIGTKRKRFLRNQEAESSVTGTEAMKNTVENVDTSQIDDDTPEPSLSSKSPASEKNVEDELVKAAMDASSEQDLEPQEAHQVPDCSEVIKAAEDFVKRESIKNEEMMLIQAARESQNREVEVTKPVTVVREEYKKPLNIVVDNVSVIKEAESTTCEDNEIPQKEFSSDEDKQAEYSSKISQNQELKLTITKTKTDEPSSILKIYDPKHPGGVEISPSESETENEELPIPKFVIKQSSPKVMSPLKITIKPVLKPEEQHTQKGSPKLIIKPIVKPDDESKHPEEKHHSPKITIKPIMKPSDDSDRCNSPKITIKPLIKPAEASTSPKIKFKPVLKPEEVKEEVAEEVEKERIVLKINKNNIPQKEVKKNEDNEKLGKIKVKFSKEGRHAHIVNDEEQRQHLNEAEAIKQETTIDTIPKETATPEPELVTEHLPPKVETSVNSPALSVDSPVSDVVIPVPRKRGRPRKIPLVIREEFKDLKEQEKPNAEGASASGDSNRGRPKRSCRGPSVTMTLGIKPRKPRGAGRGRIGSRGGGRVEKEPKKGKISESKLKLIKEAAITARVSESLENQDVVMTTVGNQSPIVIEDSSEDKSKDSIIEDKHKVLCEDTSKDSGNFKTKEDSGEHKSRLEPTVIKEEIKQDILDIKEEGLDISESVIMYEEETRMSAEINSSRAQTPAKQVLTSNVQDVVEESQSSVQSSATTESAKGKKGTRLDVFREPEGAIISADQLAEYYWGGGGPYMLQEQVAQFLGIKSFKRKYPGIQRRTVDMQERDFIRESSLASEHMCDLGLTAVNSADILDIMYSDFQNKYEEYCKHLRDRQTKDITNKQKALSIAASQEKTKLDIMQQAVESAAQWNISFNKTRREERKACMDLQTFTINYPKGSVKQIPKNKIGHYPIALVPGQYTDYYRTYTPTELNNLPLNTMLYHPINVHNDDDSQSDGSGSETDSSSSGSDSSDSDSSDEDCTICSPSATPKKAVL